VQTQKKKKTIISRRKFINTAGLILGASTLSPVLPILNSTLKNRTSFGTVKVGLLQPISNIYPQMGRNLINGLNLYAKEAQQNYVIINEQPDFGSFSLENKVLKLIESDRVDIITGIVSEAVSGNLKQILNKNNILFIANHVGANLPQSHAHCRRVIHNSLNYWQANWAMGAWSAKNLGKNAYIASSFYESGYDALFAFNQGFESEGGKILKTRITNLPSEMKNTGNIYSDIKYVRPDFVFGSYSGSEAIDFMAGYRSAGLFNNIPLVGSGFMVDDSILPQLGSNSVGLKSCMPWALGLQNDANKSFASAYKMMNGRKPDAFALLGYETGILIDKILTASNGNLCDNNRLNEKLPQIKIETPRGKLTYISGTQYFNSPLYLREVQSHGFKLQNRIINKMPPVSETIENLALDSQELKTGWLNPYLCA